MTLQRQLLPPVLNHTLCTQLQVLGTSSCLNYENRVQPQLATKHCCCGLGTMHARMAPWWHGETPCTHAHMHHTVMKHAVSMPCSACLLWTVAGAAC